MKNFVYLLVLVFFVSACSSGSNSERPAGWEGDWEALWVTDSASFEGISGITDFTMPGKVTFQGDKVTIKAFGFEGCVFSKDTLDHSLSWKVSNDSLILINDEDTPGMVYQIMNKTNDVVELKLMDDIFLTLSK
ncbi:MAG: hypothetical protein JXR10_02470 [Cyclobacteriaceae bacterium]